MANRKVPKKTEPKLPDINVKQSADRIKANLTSRGKNKTSVGF